MKRLNPGIEPLALLAALTGSLVWGQPPITPNNVRLRGAALGANPALVVTGLDAAIGLEIITVGTDPIILTAPGGLTITQGALTAAGPNLSGTATWNNVAVTFTGWLLNVTDTTSAAASLLADFQIGGTSRFSVGKSGNAILANGGNANISPLTLTGGTITTSNPLLTGTQTWNAAGVTFEGLLANITNTASAAGSRMLSFQRGGTLQFAVTSGATGTGLRLRTAQQAVPTCANCGATGTVAGTDAAGIITIAGAGPASPITVTFSGTYESVPACTAANRTTAANSISRVDSTVTTAVIYFLAGPGAADLIAYTCLGTS